MMNEFDQVIAEAAINLPRQHANIVGEDEIALWHLVRSLLEWCDHKAIDFDLVVENVREDFNSE